MQNRKHHPQQHEGGDERCDLFQSWALPAAYFSTGIVNSASNPLSSQREVTVLTLV